ncbi:hypothetical protein ACFWXK_33425 [Streptomyces sp. NPDC059070]|uniref:hypothetical protein n=1 Tax=Streptomyces sp. NPDC059070 TaxID=3346713 RepID=UPI0036BB989E
MTDNTEQNFMPSAPGPRDVVTAQEAHYGRPVADATSPRRGSKLLLHTIREWF